MSQKEPSIDERAKQHFFSGNKITTLSIHDRNRYDSRKREYVVTLFFAIVHERIVRISLERECGITFARKRVSHYTPNQL